jgi:hypothetical protein
MELISAHAQLASGKDTLCDYLVLQLNKKKKKGVWERSSFAGAVKKVFCDAFAVDLAFIEKWKRIDEPPPGMLMPVRKALQFIGDGFRKIKDDIWIEIALRNETKSICISDGRYHNEAIATMAKGGFNILMYRPGYLNNDENPSEAQLRPLIDWCIATNQKDGPIDFGVDLPPPPNAQYYDFFLINDGTVEELYAKIDSILIPYLDYMMLDNCHYAEF